MPQPFKLKTKRIAAIVAPGALLIAIIVAAPHVQEKIDDYKEQAQKARESRVNRYMARLGPCIPQIGPASDPRLRPAPGEIAIDVLPSFSPVYGLRISGRAVRSYTGDQTLFMPPPLPPPGSDDVEIALNQPRATFSPVVELNPDLGDQINSLFRTEIDRATASTRLGHDGATFYFRHNGKCGSTWMPLPDTRAYQLTRLLGELVLYTRSSNSNEASAEDIERLFIQLESDRLFVDG